MSKDVYAVPSRYRRMENLHIVFWLFKDISWCMIWKPLGMAMIIPTMAIAFIIAARTRQYIGEWCHNLAVVFWITANSYWMISEFLHFDTNVLIGDYTFKHLAIIPFVMGIIVLGYYYLWWKPGHKSDEGV